MRGRITTNMECMNMKKYRACKNCAGRGWLIINELHPTIPNWHATESCRACDGAGKLLTEAARAALAMVRS